ERLTGMESSGRGRLWDLWGHYHCMLGLYLWHKQVGYEPAMAACLRAAGHICGRFLGGSERVRDAGAEEMNMAIAHIMAILYQETGDQRYLRIVRQVEEDFTVPPSGDYIRTALQGVPYWQTPKPRWESLHAIQAVLCLYQITGDDDYRRAFEHIWRSIRATDVHNTGGFTSGEQAVGNPYDPRAIETCCTVAWMVLSVDMLRLTGDPTVADTLELATYNGALGAMAPSGRWWTYDTPMDGVRKASAHHIVFQSREGSPELNCCSVNAPRSIGLLSEWAVMTSADGAVVNYYGPGSIVLSLPGGVRVQFRQETDYPLDGRVRLYINPEAAARFSLRLRIPAWSTHTRASINGRALSPTAGVYLEITREWRNGDLVELDFDVTLHTWIGEREAEGKVSLYRGPLLLAWDRRFNNMDPDALPELDLAALQPRRMAWSGSYPEPWLLLELPAADGNTVVLCDFCTAGMTGTPYCSWLPCKRA
ncbi:MAG: hypothetical protein GX557_04000, partial [Chloroflexi bacterium]|nr:hypothetical protein [Chloroflexota bacterium]